MRLEIMIYAENKEQNRKLRRIQVPELTHYQLQSIIQQLETEGNKRVNNGCNWYESEHVAIAIIDPNPPKLKND